MQIRIFNWRRVESLYKDTSINKSYLEKELPQYFNKEKNFSDIESINIIFTTLNFIHELNKEYRDIDTPTDVLSFNVDNIGEIYISLDFIKNNIDTEDIAEEIIRDMVHGILHILGYDHKDKFNQQTKDKEIMFVKQEKILQNIYHDINNRVR